MFTRNEISELNHALRLAIVVALKAPVTDYDKLTNYEHAEAQARRVLVMCKLIKKINKGDKQ